jgi:hypothetical protein
MDFRVEHEIKVIRKVVKHVHGPCLFCNREIEYEKGIPPKARSMALLESLLCGRCQATLPVIRQETAAEREKVLRRRAELSARYRAAVEAEREREGCGWSQEADFS